MILPLKLRIITNTISTDGLFTYSIEDALGEVVEPEQTHRFPTTMSKGELLDYLKDVLRVLETLNVSLSSSTDIEFVSNSNDSLQKKDLAKLVINNSFAEGIKWRALALILLDEINNLRQWDASLKLAFANNSTVANIRNAVAALPASPDRTIAQLKTAYTNKIDAGSAD